MADLYRKCKITECNGNSHHMTGAARGFCLSHYKRWRRHGDACGGGTQRGAPAKYIKDVVADYRGKECLIWPFAKTSAGYAWLHNPKGSCLVSRIVCEDKNGPAPTENHEAAHSCGNGHLGCIAPNHLHWATRSENQLERSAHGTSNRGERQAFSNLSRS